MVYARMLAVALTLVAVGCASAPTDESNRPRRDPNRITIEELEQTPYNNVYDLVRAMRPAWIQTRGAVSIHDPTAGQVIVYLDGSRLGGAEQLRQLRVADVASIQYLNATDASARFGLGHVGGAILVSSRIGS